jgi:CO/xanthine dehydrogenase Mo-binding subunit
MSIDLGPSLAVNPLLSQWIRFAQNDLVLLKLGKVEIGQGIVTALVQIATEELDLSWGRVQPVSTDTVDSPDEGITAGSRSVMTSAPAVRLVCAQVRALLLDAAAQRAGVPRESLRVVDGAVFGPSDTRYGSYWELLTPSMLAVPVTGDVAPKPPAEHTLVGRSLPRLDLPDKFGGRPRYVHDLVLPGMRYARMVRPPAPGAQLLDVDTEPARRIGTVVEVVRRGSVLGVVAELEEDAVRAAEKLRAECIWQQSGELPDMAELSAFLREQPTEDVPIATPVARVPDDRVRRTVTRSYRKPYIAHASIAPGCAVARWRDGLLEVWTHSQGIYPLRSALAKACDLDPAAVVVRHVEGAGCYGHNSADDVAFDAALLARAVPGPPVQVVWSRDDEFRWEPYCPAALCEVSAGVDEAGNIVRWHQQTWSGGHNGRPGYAGQPGFLGLAHAADADPPVATDYPLQVGGGIGRNGVPGYHIEELEMTASRVLTMPLRTSSLRGLGATVNVFAIESTMDELAELAGADPLEYRLRHLRDERARTVLETVGRMAGWAERADRTGREDSVGWGVAYSRYKEVCGYCAVIACVEAVSEVRVRRLYLAVDAGEVINPDGLRNQIEGGAVQATSWSLLEEVTFDRKNVTSSDWDGYPILRFSDVPEIEVELISRPDELPLGVGEVAGGPVTAAIANAVADAIGVRVRTLPLTAENIVAAMPDDVD